MTKKVLWSFVFAVGFVISLIICNLSDLNNDLRNIQGKVLRIHILANSNLDYDQALKLQVKDEILSLHGDIFSNDTNLYESEMTLLNNIDRIEKTANEVVDKCGFDYSVSCNLVHIDFPEKTYGDITLPAGDYDALQVKIGEAKGENWWCMIYPQICVATAICEDETEYFTENEIKMLKNPKKVKIKFKVIEFFRLFSSIF